MKITWGIFVAALWISAAPAQVIRLHDRAKDEAAQKAAEAAKKVASGSLFDAELKNLDIFAKLEIDSMFEGEARVTRNLLNQIASGTWTGLDLLVSTLKAQLSRDAIDARIASLTAEQARLQARLAAIHSHKPPAGPAIPGNPAEAVANIIGQGIDLDNAAASLAGGLKKPDASTQQAIDEIGKVLAEGQTAADVVAANQKTVTDTAEQLAQLRSSLNGLAADRVKLELTHTETLLKIWNRAGDDMAQTQNLVADYERLSAAADHTKTVFDSVLERAATARAAAAGDRRARRNELDAAVNLPFLAAALGARWNSAELIGRLREAQEMHRYSIQRSRLEAHAYEVAVGAGGQRLAMFYKGGVRPEMIAQILYTLATASISGTLAATR